MTKFNFLLKIKLTTNFFEKYFLKNSIPDNPKITQSSSDPLPPTLKNSRKFIFQSKIKLTAFQLGKNKSIFFKFRKSNLNHNMIPSNQGNSVIAVCNFPFKFQNFLDNLDQSKTTSITLAPPIYNTEALGSSSKNPNRLLYCSCPVGSKDNNLDVMNPLEALSFTSLTIEVGPSFKKSPNRLLTSSVSSQSPTQTPSFHSPMTSFSLTHDSLTKSWPLGFISLDDLSDHYIMDASLRSLKIPPPRNQSRNLKMLLSKSLLAPYSASRRPLLRPRLLNRFNSKFLEKTQPRWLGHPVLGFPDYNLTTSLYTMATTPSSPSPTSSISPSRHLVKMHGPLNRSPLTIDSTPDPFPDFTFSNHSCDSLTHGKADGTMQLSTRPTMDALTELGLVLPLSSNATTLYRHSIARSPKLPSPISGSIAPFRMNDYLVPLTMTGSSFFCVNVSNLA